MLCLNKYFWLIHVLLLILISNPPEASAQLQELDINPISVDGAIPVFRSHPDMAAIIIRSSLTNLTFSSNLQIIEERSDPAAGEYILIIEPVTQTIRIDTPGFLAGRIPVRGLSARQVVYYSVEPTAQQITETGTLLLRSDPAGARIRLVGVPGEFETPVSFDDLLAQTYSARFELDGYESKEVEITIDPLAPNIRDVVLTPTYGYLTLNTEDARLFVSTESLPEEYRISYTPNQRRQLDVDEYQYRVSREFYRDAAGSFSIRPGDETRLNVTLEPDYATLRVSANVGNFSLTSPDNHAPPSGSRNLIYLERGQRQVTVDAPGYAPVNLNIVAQAGTEIDTTVILISEAELSERQRREQLPRGILNLSSDVDAEIYVNGENRGMGSVSLSMVPDTYRVEMRHELGREQFSIQVPSADIAEQHITFLPSKSTALTRSALLPGMGHIYTKRSRGYLYLALAGAAAGYAVYNYLDYRSLSSDHDQAVDGYQNAGSVQEAARFRNDIEQLHTARFSAHDNIIIGAGAFGAIYLLQLADVAITSPQFGYRTESGNEFRAGLMAGRIGVQFRF